MKPNIVCGNDKFELWDGGHCYFRLWRNKAYPHLFDVLRQSNFMHIENLRALGQWASTLTDQETTDAAR